MKLFAERTNTATVPIVPMTRAAYPDWRDGQPESVRRWLELRSFEPKDGSTILIPGAEGKLAAVVLGLGDGGILRSFATLPRRLPPGRYAVEGRLEPPLATACALGWALGTYRFRRYKSGKAKPDPVLVWPTGCDRSHVERTYEAMAFGRDLISTPAGDMGPAELAAAAGTLARRHRGSCTVIQGRDLEKGFPAIHAVGRAATRERGPRLIDLNWGDRKAPLVVLIGKGVVFDSGGLDLKNAANMLLMKKDMGGGASVLAIAHMVMDAGLNLRLRVLIPAVENSVSADAYRPGDVLRTRKGITVEVGNTDAEGRLVLCDALAAADAERPDLIIDFATLTGAARIALGTELPALFCNNDQVADALIAAGQDPVDPDPMWRMPLYTPYRRHLDSPLADMNNVASHGFGGAILAALFLREFVSEKTPWAHIDTMAWNTADRPGRPTGGEVFGARATFRMLEGRYGRRATSTRQSQTPVATKRKTKPRS